MDNCCGTAGSVGTRAGEQLHNGRVHPYFACARNCYDSDQHYPGTKTWANDLQILMCLTTLNNNKRVCKLIPFNSQYSTSWAGA